MGRRGKGKGGKGRGKGRVCGGARKLVCPGPALAVGGPAYIDTKHDTSTVLTLQKLPQP